MGLGDSLIFLIGFGVIALIGSRLYKKYRSRSLPTLSEDEFLARVLAHCPDAPASVIEQRNRLAGILRVPSDKLNPSFTVGQVISKFDYLGDVRLGLSDIEDEIEEDLGERLELSEDDHLARILVALDLAARSYETN